MPAQRTSLCWQLAVMPFRHHHYQPKKKEHDCVLCVPSPYPLHTYAHYSSFFKLLARQLAMPQRSMG